MNIRIFACLALLSPVAGATAAAAEEDAAARPSPAAGSSSAAPSPAAEEPSPPWEDPQPPPGSPEDRALWAAAVEVTKGIKLERLEANKIQWGVRNAQVLERLQAAARQEGEKGKRAAELLQRFGPALSHNHTTLTRQWPVDPTRGCGYPVLNFEGVLYSEAHPRRATQLLVVREDLQDCVARARPALEVMAASNRELRKLMAEMAPVLPPLASAAPAAGPGPASDAPAKGSGSPSPAAKN